MNPYLLLLIAGVMFFVLFGIVLILLAIFVDPRRNYEEDLK